MIVAKGSPVVRAIYYFEVVYSLSILVPLEYHCSAKKDKEKSCENCTQVEVLVQDRYIVFLLAALHIQCIG